MNKYYTGVGSRKTPQDIIELMHDIAINLQRNGYILRSGGADGADKAFESGAGSRKNIFYAKDATSAAMEIAARFHPAWDRCSMFAKRLHGRNSFQVLGPNLNEPSEFLICWTPDGCKRHVDRKRDTGGTGTAISIADTYGVPIYNLADRTTAEVFDTWLRGGNWIGELSSHNDPPQYALHTIYTAHYRYGGPDRTDLTVKGQDRMGKYFAPTWEMVMGVKNGTMSEQDYIDLYVPNTRNTSTVLGRVPVKAWEWLLGVPTRTFVCFCNKDDFCHRNILLNYLLKQLSDKVQYGGWRE